MNVAKYGTGVVLCNWIRSDEPIVTFINALCPNKHPLIWEYKDKLYLIQPKIIKNARRVFRDRQAFNDQYNEGEVPAPIEILLDQALALGVSSLALAKQEHLY
jgi:hypothetical protein